MFAFFALADPVRWVRHGAVAIDYNEDSDPDEFAEPEPLTVYTLCKALGVSSNFIKTCRGCSQTRCSCGWI